MRDAIVSLCNRGIRVQNVIPLGSSYNRSLQPTVKLIASFHQRFGRAGEKLIESVTGYEILSLTFGELSAILEPKGGYDGLNQKISSARARVFHQSDD